MINMLIVLFGVSMLYMATSSRIGAQINMLKLQGVILCLITFINHGSENLFALAFLILETFVVKALVIPMFLERVARKNNIRRDKNPNFPNFYTLVVSTIVLFAGFLIANVHSEYMTNISSLYFGISVSTIITSFLFIAIKKKLLTHVIGFAMLENGIFLLSLAVAKEMPMIVNMGILLDVFVAVFILGLLISEIGQVYDENPDVAHLTNLKDCEAVSE